MKKIIASIITIIILLTMISINSYAASVSISNTASSSTKVGDTVKVTVKFPVPVGTAYFKLTYPTSVLTYTGGSDTGSITYSYIDSTFQNKTISSASFSFRVKAEGSATVTMGTPELSDASGNPVSASGTSTSLTIKAQPVATPTPSTSNSNTATTSNSSTSSSSAAKTNTNNTKKTENKKQENAIAQTSEPVLQEEVNEVVNEVVNEIVEENTNEISNEIIVATNAKPEEKEKIIINYSSLIQVVAIGLITAIAIVEAIIIAKINKKKSKELSRKGLEKYGKGSI